MFENFRPLGKYILIKFKEVEEKTSGGLFLAPSSPEKNDNRIGIVLAIGEKVESIKINDHIFIGRLLVKPNDELGILIEEDVLGIM